MSRERYSEEELRRYFTDPSARRARGGRRSPGGNGLRGYFHRRFDHPDKAEAAFVLSLLSGLVLAGVLILGLWSLFLLDDLPTFEQLDNPSLQLATVAYTADNRELARFAFQNRSWVTYNEISPHVINALIATEDHRFHSHWGIDVYRTFAAVMHTLVGNRQGGSSISQQLARNLYNQEIGFEVNISRKLKEWLTAVHLERRYTKREIIEMYLNTVEFGYNAWGIEAAAQTFFSKSASELSALEGATLIGMLQGITRFNPARNPERAQGRRNVVLQQMTKHGFLSRAFYEEHQEDPVVTEVNRSSEITTSFAPYFAEQVRQWTAAWARRNGYNVYSDGLRVYTTIDSEMQRIAQRALDTNMEGLQAVVNYDWSTARPRVYTSLAPYMEISGYEPFDYFWRTRRDLVDSFVRGTDRFRSLRTEGLSPDQALAALHANGEFMDSLKTAKTRLEAGLVAIDPHNGYVKAWVGGRDLAIDWYDHVNTAARQPGSTFKPFVYTAAIDNGWSPYTRLPDSMFTYRDPVTGQVWTPRNSGGYSGTLVTLRDALARSLNTVTARVATQLINPSQIAFYARRMGIESPLEAVPALSLGTSDVTLLELTSAYGTLAGGGLHYDPVLVTRIEDRFGNVLYEHTPTPEEALSEETAYTVVDMLRGVVSGGTGVRIISGGPSGYGLSGYDLAGKTGTTQNNADGWFVLMHPDLVVGSWVGFNDRRVTFRNMTWGQGARNALFIVGSFFRGIVDSPEITVSNSRFPRPEEFGVHYQLPVPRGEEDVRDRRPEPQDRRLGW